MSIFSVVFTYKLIDNLPSLLAHPLHAVPSLLVWNLDICMVITFSTTLVHFNFQWCRIKEIWGMARITHCNLD